MELYQLQTFITVADAQSITGAAKRLFTTPSSVSAHIKALEDELGVQLFVRTSRGMQITDKGQLLYVKAQDTVQSAQALLTQATALQNHLIGQVTIGLNASAMFLRVSALIDAMTQACAGIDLSFVSSASGHIIERILDESLDIGFVFGEVDNPQLRTHKLQTTELVVAVPKAWEDQVQRAEWTQIADMPWIFSERYCPFQVIINDLLAERGLEVKRVVKSDDDMTRAQLVVAGVGLSLLEISEAHALVDAGQITIWETDPVYSDLSLIYLARQHNTPMIQAITQQILTLWR